MVSSGAVCVAPEQPGQDLVAQPPVAVLQAGLQQVPLPGGLGLPQPLVLRPGRANRPRHQEHQPSRAQLASRPPVDIVDIIDIVDI